MEPEPTRTEPGKRVLTTAETFAMARDHYAADRLPDADRLCTAIIQAAPHHLDALNLLGLIAQKVNRHDRAIEQFKKAIAIDDKQAALYYNLAISLDATGELDQAVRVLQTALDKEPDNPAVTGLLKSITRPADHGRKDAEELLQQGNRLFSAGRLEQAADRYRQILAKDPDHLNAMINLGSVLQMAEKFDAAAAYYKKSRPDQPRRRGRPRQSRRRPL